MTAEKTNQKSDHASERRFFPMTDEGERLLNRRMVSDAIKYPGVGIGNIFCDLADAVSRVKLVEMMTDKLWSTNGNEGSTSVD